MEWVGSKREQALVLARVLGQRMGPASLEKPRKKQVGGREDLLLLVACGLRGPVGVQRVVICMESSPRLGATLS